MIQRPNVVVISTLHLTLRKDAKWSLATSDTNTQAVWSVTVEKSMLDLDAFQELGKLTPKDFNVQGTSQTFQLSWHMWHHDLWQSVKPKLRLCHLSTQCELCILRHKLRPVVPDNTEAIYACQDT